MNRITWIDNFKFFCIFAVMAEHAEMLTGYTDALNTTFYVIGFFFASGYLYKHRDGFWKFFKKKVVQLLIPWFIFSMLIIVSAKIFTFGNHDESLWDATVKNLMQIRYHGDEMWFVAALFVCFMPMYFLIKWVEKNEATRKRKVICAFIVLLVLSVLDYLLAETFVIGGMWHQYPWHLEYLFTGLLLMFTGYMFRNRFEQYFDRINTPVFTTVMVILLFTVAWVPQFSHHTFNTADGVLYRYLSCTVGIMTIVAISKKIKFNRYMSFIGRNTLTYYGLHGKVEAVIAHVCTVYIGAPYLALCYSFQDSAQLTAMATASTYLLAFVVSIILIIPAWLIEKYLPFMTGKGFTKKNK